jgi:hypothetical protein
MGSTMILPDFVLPSRVHQQWEYSGMDSIDYCLDKNHFLSYPHKVHYSYNSRGFRDEEWPNTIDELKSAVWCVGDSFTVGVGQPFDHIWPQVLSKKLDRRTINISMDGASNHWIARRVQTIVDIIHPRYIVILWSYTHRREHANQLLNDEQRRIPYSTTSVEEDYSNWLELLESINPSSTKIVHSTIPDFHPIINYTDTWNNIKDQSWPECPCTIADFENLPKYILDEMKNVHGCYDEIRTQLESSIIHIRQRLDCARDHHHFDILTAQWLVSQIWNQFLD